MVEAYIKEIGTVLGQLYKVYGEMDQALDDLIYSSFVS